MPTPHFTLDVSPDQVRAARQRVKRVLELLGERTPPVVATADEVDADWTGPAAERVKAEMRALGKQLDSADKPLKDASRSLRNLADAYRDALDELPSLNRRWEESLDAYESAVGSANDKHTGRLGDIASSKKDETESKEARDKADTRRDNAIDEATTGLKDAQRQLTKEFEDLRGDVQRETRLAARDLRAAMLISPNVIEELHARGGFDNKFRRRHWTDLARRRLAESLPLTAEHHAAVEEVETKQKHLSTYGMEVPEGYDQSRGGELVDELNAKLTELEGLDAAARSKAINTWAEGLDPVDLSLLTMTDPALVGALDGIPNRARYAANQMNLSTGIEAERAQLEKYWDPKPSNDHPQWAEYSRLVERIKMLEQLQVQPKGKEPHQVLLFEPPTYDGNKVVDDGKLAAVKGNLDTATFVGTVVPGITNRLDNFNATLEKATNTHNEVPDSATIAWLGYDTPEFSDASLTEKSEVGGLALKNFTEGLVRKDGSEMTIMAHSYGTLVTSKALQMGMRPDRVVLFGSPGLGENIHHKDDLGLPADVPVYAMRAYGDPVSITAGHGTDPVDLPGIIRLDTDWLGGEDVTGHSQYTAKDSQSLMNISGVLAGFTVRPPGVQGPGYLEAGGNSLDKDGFAGAYNENLRDLVDVLQAEVPPENLERFVLALEPTLQNMTADGGEMPGVEDIRGLTALVREAMDTSELGDHLSADELQDALIEAGFADKTGELAGDWVRDNVSDMDFLDDAKINVRGFEIHMPDNANEALGDLLGRGTDGAVEDVTAWTAERLPDLGTILDTADKLGDIVQNGTKAVAVIKAIPEAVRATPRIIVSSGEHLLNEGAERVGETVEALDDARETVTDGVADGVESAWKSKANPLNW